MTGKLSAMMLVGDTLRTRNHATYLSRSGDGWCGCALGGAQLACGKTGHMAWLELWSWVQGMDEQGIPYYQTINRKFQMVAQGYLTMDELVEWVESVEPQDVPEREEELELAMQG